MAKAKPNFGGVTSVEISGGPSISGESAIRRSSLFPDKLVSQPFEGIDTVYDVLQYSARKYGTKNAYGYRDVLNMIEEEKEVTKMVDGKETKVKKTWKYFQLSDYKYISFIEFRDTAIDIGKGLVELGIGKGEIFNIYAQTRRVTLSIHLLVTIHLHTPLVLTGSMYLMLAQA